MSKFFILFWLLNLSVTVNAQHKVQFILKEKTVIHHDSIYITGTFSNWDSTTNKNYLMHPVASNEKSMTLNLPSGTIRYKFHRGSWLTVEKQYNGDEVSDRVITVKSDSVLIDSVSSWRDQVIIDDKLSLQQEKEDSSRLFKMANIAEVYAFNSENYNADSALFYANEALLLQQSIVKSAEYSSITGRADFDLTFSLKNIIASLLHSLGNYSKSLEIRLENLGLAEKAKDKFFLLYAIEAVNHDYESMNDFENMLHYGKTMDSLLQVVDTTDIRFKKLASKIKYTIANAYYHLNQPDSALFYANIAWKLPTAYTHEDTAFTGLLLGNVYAKMGNDREAFFHYRLSSTNAYEIENPQVAAGDYEGIARLLEKEGRPDSALYFAKLALSLLQTYKVNVLSWGENTDTYIAEISPLIAELYKAKGQPDSAYKYLLQSVTLKDSLYNTDKIRQFQTLSFNDALHRRQLEQQSEEQRQQYKTKIKMYGLITVITGFVILAFILYRNNRHKQKANALLYKQKKEIENTLGELRNTQKQLIQSEKMASLGELTAGIAHEIQNPLNFVNNFSEVNKEMIDEAGQEIDKGNIEEVKSILTDLRENEEKINHHGKRADSIVKGMLQHSRASSGKKESTDINALCDEYLRLSYHGLRAKDKSFTADLKTDLDPSLSAGEAGIGRINIVPQDIGRVLLNLYNNAFYAVSEKSKAVIEGYSPVVQITTSRLGNHVTITVSDNGNGIPQNIVDKIFQPFFTTKPTGEGTGLGLSLSYDIIKAHGGEIKVETKENQRTTFEIILPADD